QSYRFLVHQQVFDAGGRVGHQSHRALPIGRRDITGKHIERFNKVTVPIYDLHTHSFQLSLRLLSLRVGTSLGRPRVPCGATQTTAVLPHTSTRAAPDPSVAVRTGEGFSTEPCPSLQPPLGRRSRLSRVSLPLWHKCARLTPHARIADRRLWHLLTFVTVSLPKNPKELRKLPTATGTCSR